MDKLSAMTTFVTVIELESFSRAAELLQIPNARVSQRVADLEKYLGIRLINRTTRSVNLTNDGAVYFLKCKRLLEEIDELENEVTKNTSILSGNIRIEALISIARWIIAPKLHEFYSQQHNITVRLSCSDHMKNILEDGLDCSIRSGNLEDSSLIARHLGDVYFGLYASPSYLDKFDLITHPTMLENLNLISWFSNPKKPFVWQLHNQINSFNISKKASLEFDDPDSALMACISGFGISPGAPFSVAQYIKDGLLVPVLPEWHFDKRPIHIVYTQSKYLSARVRYFINWLISVIENNPYLKMTPLELKNSFMI